MELTTKFNEFEIVYMADINQRRVRKMRVRKIEICVWDSRISETYNLFGDGYEARVASKYLFHTHSEAEDYLNKKTL